MHGSGRVENLSTKQVSDRPAGNYIQPCRWSSVDRKADTQTCLVVEKGIWRRPDAVSSLGRELFLILATYHALDLTFGLQLYIPHFASANPNPIHCPLSPIKSFLCPLHHNTIQIQAPPPLP